MWEKALGRDHPDVALSLSNLGVYSSRGRYADAEPLLQQALAIWEKALGGDHPDVARALNNLAELYRIQGRYVDAFPIITRTLSQGTANKIVAFPVFFASQSENLISAGQALANSYEIVQRASSSAAANAVSKLAARFAAGTGELAQLVRRDQDLTVESERLDKTIIAAVSRRPAERNAAAEDQICSRIGNIKLERDKLQNIFDQRFPEYVALSEQQPLVVEQSQALLVDDEALIIFDFDVHSYAWVITRTSADWAELKISAKDLTEQVRQLRQSLTFDTDKPFDGSLAHKVYQETFGLIADKFQNKKRISVVTNGALTSLPLELLVTQDPSGKLLTNIDWLVRSYAITILPSVYSLKTLRAQSAMSAAKKANDRICRSDLFNG
jgi:tetratricopeptide (TPR) repeat protein